MKAKNLIIGGSVLAAAIVGFIIWKKRKASAAVSTPTGLAGGTTTTGTGSSTTTGGSAATSSVGGTIHAHIEDSSQKKHIITVKTADAKSLKSGDKVKVTSNKINGTFQIWYVYTGTTGYNNLYLSTPFVAGSTGGTWSKV